MPLESVDRRLVKRAMNRRSLQARSPLLDRLDVLLSAAGILKRIDGARLATD